MPKNTKKLFLLFVVCSLLFVHSVHAAPSASPVLSGDKRFINVTFNDLKNVSRVSYTVTYSTSSGEKGFEGGFKPNTKTRKVSKRQILGTCSSGKCVYHQGVSKVSVTTTFVYRTGGSSTVTKAL
jgi:hypothetical protein